MTPAIKARDGVLRGGAAIGIRLLLLAAAAISAYLLSVSLSGGHAVGCAPGSGCDAVLQSRWAYVLGVPVSGFAIAVDLALLLTTFACGPRTTAPQRRNAWELLVPGALLVIGAALWFVAVQAVIVQRFCPWCMTAHLCGATAAVLLLMRLPMRETVERKDKDPALPRAKVMKLGVIAMSLVMVLAAAQIVVAPKTYAVKTIAAAPPKPSIFFDVYNGAVKVDLTRVPIWGSPNAKHKLLSLYDYTCQHCAEMHPRVSEVQQHFSNDVVLVSLPMPLDSACNPVIARTPAAHSNGCQYARLGLAVWLAKPAVMGEYDTWFFGEFHQHNRPPAWDAATNRAAQLVGGLPALENALNDSWVAKQLEDDIAIYTTSFKQYHNSSMPQFIIGSNLVAGTMETPQLKELVAKYVRGF